MTREHEETPAQFEARFLKSIQDRTPREAMTAAAEPADCPFCGTTPAAAYGAGEPMPMLDAGWLLCPCLGPEWTNVAEEMLRRKSLAEKGKDARFDGWRQVHWEDTQGRFNRDEFTPQSEKNKARDKVVKVDAREEQDWQGWADDDPAMLDRLQRLDRPVNCRIPRWAKRAIEERAHFWGTTTSDAMRTIMGSHLIELPHVPKIGRAHARERFRFCVTEHWAILLRGKCLAMKVSQSDLVTALLAAEFAG